MVLEGSKGSKVSWMLTHSCLSCAELVTQPEL